MCTFILPTKLHLSHLTSREERASSGEDTHLSDIERSNKKGKAMNNLFCAKLQKIPNLQQNMEGAWIWLFQSSTIQNGEEEIQRFTGEGKVTTNFYAACLIKKRSSLP